MGQPTPPGDNIPLVEGLGPEWNEFVSAIPEDKRAELGPKLKERVSSYQELEPWKDFQSKGITPEQASQALTLYDVIERNPRDVYETIGRHLGITPQQAKTAVEDIQEEIDEGDEDDPRIQRLQQQVDTLAQIALAKSQQETKAQQDKEAEDALNAEIAAVQKKYGDDIPEDHLLMRMMHMNMTAEQAAQDYIKFVEGIRARRPAPYVLGGGGTVPNRQIDPTKLSSQDTKGLVAQMMAHAAAENNK